MANFTTRDKFVDIASDSRLIREVGELVVTEYVENQLSDIGTVETGIKGRQQISTVTPGEKYTTKYKKEPDFTDGENITSVDQTWNPQVAQFRRRIHFNDFINSWEKWLIGDQGNATAFDTTQVFNFITEYFAQGFYSDIVRIVVHGKSNLTSGTASQAKNAGRTNILGSANDVKFYDIIDYGIVETFKLWRYGTDAKYTALRENFVDIALNANTRASGVGGATGSATNPTGEQYNLPTNFARNLFDQLVYQGTINVTPNTIITNGALVRNLQRSLTKNDNLQSNEDRFISGQEVTQAYGSSVQELFRYDQHRRGDFTRNYNAVTGTNKAHTDTAHFALWYNRENLKIALNAESALSNLRITFPDASDDYVYVKGDYELDVKFILPVLGGFRCAL